MPGCFALFSQREMGHTTDMRRFPIVQSDQLPPWRRPIVFLFLTAIGMPIAFSTWAALLNNFVVEVAQFDGADIGLLHTIREIPGFLAVAVIVLLYVFREQVLGIVSLALLGAATAVTAWYPSLGGILTITLLSSIGFHYYETVNQSLQLQWIRKDRAPVMLGLLTSAGSAANLVIYVLLVLTWQSLGLSFNTVFLLAGGLTCLIALAGFLLFPQFEAATPQRKEFVLRRRYWLYYALQFMAGARRQIFVVFAGFMMVEKFGYAVQDIALLYVISLVISTLAAPIVGKAVEVFGERAALTFEYVGLFFVFLGYGCLYWFDLGSGVAAGLYITDHLFFAFSLAIKTYFQKIADPADIAPTAAVSFTINHIAAVVLPVFLGLLWLASPSAVFVVAALMAVVSLVLSLLIPRIPTAGHETVLASPLQTRTAQTIF